ncbi:MAG: efflux RND transporter periplasmic adaptor subunit [Planctomycetales bacterium]
MGRWIGAAIVGTLLLAAGWAVWRNLREGAPVDVATVSRGEIRTYVEELAKTRLPEIYRVTMPLDGRILPIDLVEGDPVEQGQVVARMEAADLETAVAEAGARVARLQAEIVENDDTRLEKSALAQFDELLKSMRNAVAAAEAQIQASRAKLDVASKELGRVRRLAETGAATESLLNAAQLEREQSAVEQRKDELTLASLEAIHSAMLIGRDAIEQYIAKKALQRSVLAQQRAEAEAQLERARRDLERTAIRARAGGVVLKRHVSNQQVLPAGAELLDIGQLERLQVEAEVLSQEAIDVRTGQAVEIAGPAIGRVPVAGTVERVHPQGFTKVSSLGVEQQRVLVVIDFDSGARSSLAREGRRLGVDYRVTARIVTASRVHALRVPRSALFRSPQGIWQTFVVRGGRANRVDVKLGLINDSEAEVLEGLAEGDRVVLVPESTLADGDRVEPRTNGGREPGMDSA